MPPALLGWSFKSKHTIFLFHFPSVNLMEAVPPAGLNIKATWNRFPAKLQWTCDGNRWFTSVTLSHWRFSSCYRSKTNSILTVEGYIIILILCFGHWGFREGEKTPREGNRTQVYQNQIQCLLRGISTHCKYRNPEMSPMNTWRWTAELCQHNEKPLAGLCGTEKRHREWKFLGEKGIATSVLTLVTQRIIKAWNVF